MNILNKKINIRFLLVVYWLSFLLNQLFFVDFKKVFAEDNFSKTNIVAIIVDDDVYNKNQANIKRYATDYVQKNVSNSKAVVLPINVKNIKAWDITKILENMYFDWIDGESSKLEGLILMWEVPLPVVNNNWYVFPTVYPYVDFENQKYIFDQKSDFFILNSEDVWQPEVWHWLIKFDNESDYKSFFDRIRKYDKDPSSYVMPRMWYDDFISLKKNFLSDNLPYYINKFTFAEDNAYHRYTNLFSDVLKSDYTENSLDVWKTLAEDLKNSDDAELKAYAENIWKLSEEAWISMESFDQKWTPTLLLKDSIWNFMNSYDELISSKYLSKVRDNLDASARWYRKNSSWEVVDSIEGHYEKVTKQDAWLLGTDDVKSVFVELNDFMEKKINDKIEKEKYYIHVPLLTAYNQYEKKIANYLVKKDCQYNQNDWYFNYYFWEKAFDVKWVEDTSILNWKYLNYTSISWKNTSFDTQKSIAWSYGIFSQQTESNRWYNIFNIEPELDYRSWNKIEQERERECVDWLFWIKRDMFCIKKWYKSADSGSGKEDASYFALRNRWWASPLNLDESLNLKTYNYKNAWLPISDLWWTKSIQTGEDSAYSYLWANVFWSVILVEDRYWEQKYPKYLDGKEIGIEKTKKNVSDFDFFNIYKPKSWVTKIININNTDWSKVMPLVTWHLVTTWFVLPWTSYKTKFFVGNAKLGDPCNDYPAWETYFYKTISSKKYNISPTPDQVSWMNLTTFDRPVDSQRNVTFKWIWGWLVKFDYPNIFQVQVYDNISWSLVLNKTWDISIALKNYLKKNVDKYNFQLKNQSNQKDSYYGKNKDAFDFLSSSDRLAFPKREYKNFSDTFLEDVLVEFFDVLVSKYWYAKIYWEKEIKTKQDKIAFLSELLYRLNQNIYARKYETTVINDLNWIREWFDINSRVASTVKNYLKRYDNWIFFSPDFNSTWYEVAFINSDWDNYISAKSVPSFIAQLDSIKNKNDWKKTPSTNNSDYEYKDTSVINQECWADTAWTVLLFDIKTLSSPRFEAMKCWIKKIAKNPFEIRVNFDNALWPVYVPWWEDQFGLKESKDQYINQAQKNFSVLDVWNKTDKEKNDNSSWETNQKLQKLKSNVNIDTDVSSFFVTDEKKKSFGIYSNIDLWKLDVTMSLTGDNCFWIKWFSNNLCTQKVLFSSNVFSSPREFEIDMRDKKSGFSSIMLKICLPYSSDCIEKQKIINFIPWAISNISFIAPSKRILPWAEIPFKVLAKDKYDNLVNQTVKNFNLSVSSGDWLFYFDGVLSNSITFQNFRDSDFIFKASKDTKKSVIDIILSGYNEDNLLINEKLPIEVVIWDLDISYKASILSNNAGIEYNLAENWHNLYLTWSDWSRTIDDSKLLKLSLILRDQKWIYLDSVLKVYSQNWLVFPWILDKRPSYYNGKVSTKTTFIAQKNFLISWWKLDLFFHPSFKSWKDKVVLQIPWFDDFIINVSVLPGKESRVALEFSKTNISVWKTIDWSIKIFDERGNLIDRNVQVKLWKMWVIDLEGAQDRTINWSWSFVLKDVWLVWEWYFYAILKNISLEQQVPGYQKIVVQEDLLPKEKLNVMYLNLFWSDRGNQRWYFSENNKYINEIFGKSEKTLAITTQLTDLKKLRKADIVVDQNAQIKNIWDIDTSILIQSGYIRYLFWNVGYMNIWKKSDFNISSFTVDELKQNKDWWFFSNLFGKEETDLKPDSDINQKLSYIQENIKKNTLIYFPSAPDSIIKSNILEWWKIILNGSVVYDFINEKYNQNIKITLSNIQIWWYYVFDVSFSDKYIWQIFIWRNDNYVLDTELKIYDSYRYVSKKIFADGSTNWKIWIWIIDTQSMMEEKNVSIESSYQDDLWIWFQSSFKNITLFGQGKSVGQATLPFASEFLINFWDPILKRISDNVKIDKTSFDAWAWQLVFSDSTKQISKTLLIDFNNDWLKDIIMVYKDGSIKIQKNYWWKNFDKNLQDLMMIEWWIKDVYVWDVDGNKYQDIIVWNKKNKMIVYKNNYGIFDVDGSMVCLNTNVDNGSISNTPDDLSDVSQIFLEDMDLDWNIDIITNDYDWYIKVFYGWKSTKVGGNYFSTLNYTCDSQWYARQKNNEVLVKKYGISVDSNSFLQDTSLVRRNWFDPIPEVVEKPDEEVEKDADEYDDYKSPFPNEKLSSSQIKELLKWPLSQIDDFKFEMEQNMTPEVLGDNYVPSPIDYTPINEKKSDKELYYIPIKYLSENDKISVYKKFVDLNGWMLKRGDEILVTVNLVAKQSWIYTYFEEIKWPWLVPTDDKRKIKNFSFASGYDSANIKIDWDVDPYQFMLDNVVLNWWNHLSFSYKIYYDQKNTPVFMNVKDINLPEKGLIIDWYNEISVNSTDSCLKWRYIYKSKNRIYSEIFDDIQSKVEEYLKNLEIKQNELIDDSVDSVSDIDSLAWVGKLVDSYWWNNEKWNTKSILQSLLDEWWMSLSFDTQFIDNSVAKVSEDIDKALDWLCKWFSIWKNSWCGGIPVPFNQAFLAPGKYHLFGCFNLPLTPLDKWLPVLSFPTDVPLVPVWPPTPAGAGWIFGWVTSQFRLYVAPTLTLGLGMAICLGPYALWVRLPKPFRDIVWNCVVFALPPLTGKCKAASKTPTTPGSLVTESYDDDLVNLWDNWACSKWDILKSNASSVDWWTIPTSESVFKLSSIDSSANRVFEWNLGWFVRFDEEPHTFLQENSSISFEWLWSVGEEKWFSLNSNNKVTLRILWSKIKWLMKCVIQDRETRQIKYIVNNLTKMNVTLTLPDFSDIADWISNLDTQNLSDIMTEIKQQKKDEWYVKQLTWVNRYLSEQALDNLSSSFDNPFESILELFDKVPLVNMETKDVNIRVPLLTIDQMSSYWSYLKLWLEKNDKIIERRNVAVDEMLNVCGVKDKQGAKDLLSKAKSSAELENSSLFTDKDSESCRKALHFFDWLIKFNQNSQKLVYVVKQNINILEEYKKFPFKLYEWIHVTDRYVTETISFVSSFVWKLTFRLKTNATRFAQYVDSLTILIHAIKTRQIIVDFSLDWTEKCSKCTNDNYTSYSCSLSFLCPKLPILPIPPFKIPSISLDLSHLDLGLNILLPKFNFSPIKISLPKLPDLPEPPQYQVNLDVNGLTLDLLELPAIPLLPSPPDLPELPSFIPNVEIDLPTLPPAPKIPNLSPKIESILKVAKFIWKIFCIVKWWIWLVWEKWVKAKIEQLTQRTRNVPIFDYFDLTTKYRDPPLKWFDRKLDAYLELRYNFDGVYNFINSAASFVNGFSNNLENKAAESIDSAEDWSKNEVEEIKTNIKDDIIKWSYSPSDPIYENYDDVYKELKDGINYFKLFAIDDKQIYQQLDKISYEMSTKSSISIQSENINKIAKDVIDTMEKKRIEYNNLSNKILNDYDKFISDLEISGRLVSSSVWNISFETKLLDVDGLNRDLLAKQPSPAESYLSLNQKFVDGYLFAMDENSPESLNMTQNTYDKSKKYLSDLKNKITRTADVNLYSQKPLNEKSCTNCVESSKLAYNSSSSQSSSSSNSDTKYQQDVSVYTKWIFLDSVENWENTKTNLVQSVDQIEKLWKNYFWEDINNDKNLDLIMWDESSVYVKYFDQDDDYYSKNGKSLDDYDSKYHLYSHKNWWHVLGKIDEIADDWIADFNSLEIKIFDKNFEVKNFMMKWQSFENLKFTFSNSIYLGDNVDGYVIRLNKRVDTFFDKYQVSDMIDENLLSKKYIIILPTDKYYITWLAVSFDDISKKALKNLMTWTVLWVRYFDLDQDTISVVLNEVDRSWQYAQIATLNLSDEGMGLFNNLRYDLLKQSSPWSNQILWWRQIISDDKWPTPAVTVYRPSIKKIISKWYFHEVYVNTFYDLDIEWTDDVAVSEMWISKDGRELKTLKNNTKEWKISLKDLSFTWTDNVKFGIWARDFNWNESIHTVELNVSVPDIEIISVNKIDSKMANIVSQISHDLDWWVVSFEKMVWNYRRKLFGSDSEDWWYNLVPLQTIITWWNFDLSDSVWFYDSKWNKFANINPTNWDIKIFDEYIFNFDLVVNFIENFLNVSIVDKKTNENKFNIKLPPQSLVNIELLQQKPYYDLVKLYGKSFWAFDNWYCLKNTNLDCVIYVSLSGQIYSPSIYANEFIWDYKFNLTWDYVNYYIRDKFWKWLLNLDIKVKDLLQK